MNNPNLSRKETQQNSGATQNQQSNVNPNKPFIEVKNPEKLPITNGAAILTTYDIGLKISELLSKVYADFAGVHITPVTNGGVGFAITLYFCKNVLDNAGSCNAFKVLGEEKPEHTNSIVANLQAAQQRMNAKMYTMLPEGEAGLGQFVFKQFKQNGKVNWNMLKQQGCIGEKQDNERGVLAMVTGCFDIVEFIKAIYGDKNPENKHAYQYSVMPIRPQMQPVNGMTMGSVDWLVSIAQYDMVEMQAAARKSGIISYGSGTQMVPRM